MIGGSGGIFVNVFCMVSNRKKFHALFGFLLIGISFLSFLFISPNIAPEFSGSAHLRVTFQEVPDVAVLSETLGDFAYAVSFDALSDRAYAFSTQALDAVAYREFSALLSDRVGAYAVSEYQSFSPSISQELVRKAVIALVIAMLCIIVYISFVFKGVSRPVASWKYGIVSTVALLHDALIPLGVFSLIAPFTDAAIDTLFVTALLATLGYSINDTIVVFDRIRDRLSVNRDRRHRESFDAVADYGVRRSLRRSLYTSLSTVIPLLLLFLFVPATRWFSTALFAGVIAGTYSSLFFAPSLLLLWHYYFPQDEKKDRQLSDTERAEEALRHSFRGENTV